MTLFKGEGTKHKSLASVGSDLQLTVYLDEYLRKECIADFEDGFSELILMKNKLLVKCYLMNLIVQCI